VGTVGDTADGSVELSMIVDNLRNISPHFTRSKSVSAQPHFTGGMGTETELH